MQSRRGVTLTEVLLAILIMAMGMISLLALFPVGMKNMADSSRDNRVAVVTHNAHALADAQNLRRDAAVEGLIDNLETAWNLNPSDPSPPLAIDPIGYEVYQAPAASPLPAATPPAYPIVPPETAHAFGILPPTYMNLPMHQTNGVPPTVPAVRGIPRSSVAFTSGQPNLNRRWFTYDADATFNEFGEASTAEQGLSGSIQRERRFSWAYLWKRPRLSEPGIAGLTVMVFDNRLPRTSVAGGPVGENTYAGPSQGQTPVFLADPQRPSTIRISWPAGGNPPEVRKGSWVLDATVEVLPSTTALPTGTSITTPYPFPAHARRPLYNGYFYRVTNVSAPMQVNTAPATAPPVYESQMELELETPAKNVGYVAVFLDSLAGVIDVGSGRMPQ
jgi:hypothetical protein